MIRRAKEARQDANRLPDGALDRVNRTFRFVAEGSGIHLDHGKKQVTGVLRIKQKI